MDLVQLSLHPYTSPFNRYPLNLKIKGKVGKHLYITISGSNTVYETANMFWGWWDNFALGTLCILFTPCTVGGWDVDAFCDF